MNDRPIKALLIEDDPEYAHIIHEMLTSASRAPLDLEYATQLSAGLERAAVGDIDVIILDLSSYGRWQPDTFARAHAQVPTVPIIVLSDSEDEVSAIEALQGGAQDYLVKEQLDGTTLTRMMRYTIERKRTVNTLQRQLEELVILQTIAAAAAEATDEDALIEHAVQVIDKIFYTDSLGVLLLDEQTGVLRVHPSYQAREGRKTLTIPPGHGIAGQAALDGQTRRVSDLNQEPDPMTVDPLARSALCAPLKAGTQIIGVANVESRRRNGFSAADERLLVIFAWQLAAAIERMRLMETLEQRVADRTRELSVLYDVTTVASKSLDLTTILQQSLERVLETVNGQAATIQLLDKTGETLHLAAQQGIPRNMMAIMDTVPVDGSPWSSWVIQNGEPLVVPNMSADPRTHPSSHASLPFPYAGVPMRARGKVIGVLSVVGQAGWQFTVEEVALLASIADHVGVAVENARLRQQAERTAVLEERERLGRELHDSVTQSLYSLTLFAEAGRELARDGNFERVEHHLGRIGETAQQALKEMRLMLHEMRPSILEQEGLVGALHQRLEAVEGRAGVDARLMADKLIELSAPVEEELYRIAQEALNNTLKHAMATSVTVQMHTEDKRIELEIIDNGVGFDPEAVSGNGGMGLANMRQRAERLGSALMITSAPGRGTRVKMSVRIPTDKFLETLQ
jgi:signal transduction histidine kinase/DNA-binding NarL/FixJ family response regulator